MDQNVTLSVCAICRNEEVDLPGFLAHLITWVDEIVLVDDASDDRTAEIAASFGAKVRFVRHPMHGQKHFGRQRNVAISHASGDWLLHMDIDERVTPQLAMEIRKAIQTGQYHGFRYRRLNFFLQRPMRYGGWSGWNKPQLARRGSHKFVNPVHENCIVDGGAERTGQLEHAMWHLTDASYLERMNKSKEYSRIIAGQITERRRVRAVDLLVRPFLRFMRRYIIQGGMRDGMPGLLFGLHCFCAEFQRNALAWDAQNRIDRQTMEDRVRKMWEEEKQSGI